jgi:hypothetical protein
MPQWAKLPRKARGATADHYTTQPSPRSFGTALTLPEGA